MQHFIESRKKQILTYIIKIPEIKKQANNERFLWGIQKAVDNCILPENMDFRVYPWIREIYNNLC